MLRRGIPVLRLGSRGPAGDQKSLRLCSQASARASASACECRACVAVAKRKPSRKCGVLVVKRRIVVTFGRGSGRGERTEERGEDGGVDGGGDGGEDGEGDGEEDGGVDGEWGQERMEVVGIEERMDERGGDGGEMEERWRRFFKKERSVQRIG